MIRHRHGSAYFLFTQHDHALLSGRLAERISGQPVARPSDRAIQGIALHDCGWPLHDERPILNAKAEPLHVFEAPLWVATQVWSASARRAANKDPYSGLLVSVHVLNLSAMSLASHRSPHEMFELNKFQHQQIEFQEDLRKRLGMRVDAPLTLGVARPNTSPEEDQLLFDYRLLRALDQLSLALLCSEDLFHSIDGLLTGPGGQAIQIRLERPADFHVRLNPWMFDAPRLELSVPFRRMPIQPFGDQEEFRFEYDRAGIEQVDVIVETGTARL